MAGVELLVDLLRHPDGEVQREAVTALGHAGETAALRALAAWRDRTSRQDAIKADHAIAAIRAANHAPGASARRADALDARVRDLEKKLQDLHARFDSLPASSTPDDPS
jgi:uncharacterized protein YceH (UPF0502 family)